MPPVPALLAADGVTALRDLPVPTEKSGLTTGYVLPLGGGWIPSNWSVNWWQQGYNPLQTNGSAVVYACIAAYAQTIAMCPPTHWVSTKDGDGKPDGGRERARTSALTRVLRRPNSYQSTSDFFLYLTRSLYGDKGAAYGLALRNARFEISEIHLMDPRMSWPRVATTGDVFYHLGGNEVVERLFANNPSALEAVPARDVLHVRLPSDRSPLEGVSPIQAALLEDALSNAWAAQALAFMANQGRPSGVLQTDLKLNREEVLALRQLWNEQTQGMNQGGTPILNAGLKWNSAIINSRDAQAVEHAQYSDQKIATAYRVPLAILSLASGQGPQGSNESSMEFWVKSGLGFAANHIETAFDRLFGLSGPPDDYLELDLNALLRASFKERVEAYAQGVQGGLFSPDEGRAEFEYSKTPFGAEPRVQQQVVPLSAWAQTPPATPGPPAPPASPPAPDAPQGDEPNAGGQRDWTKLIFDAADEYERRRAA